MDSLVIPVPKEFSFQQNISYLSRTDNECMYEVHPDHIIKAIPTGEEIILAKISESLNTHLLVEFPGHTVRSTEQLRNKILRYIRDWLDLDTDLEAFYDMAKRDPLLQHAVREFYGLRSIGIPDFFEAICWGILGQQINLPFAYTLKRRFVETFGVSVEWEGRKFWAFPRPETIADLTVEDLIPLQISRRKSEYLITVARLIASGELRKEEIERAGDLESAEKRLTAIRGIGPWTANYVLMRCLRFPDAFPIADVGLQNAIKQALGSETKPTKEEILKLAAPWKNWEAYATFYLWRSLG